MWEAIVTIVMVVVQTATNITETVQKTAHAAITQRRLYIAEDLKDFINLNTTTHKDVIYAVIAITGVCAILYITKRK